ncbi:MAG: SMP-30/gluconolactonase/LRE family protein [Nannocystaceae bacterium]|nr:SMP-30/gluconolactonase/LRE family protein [Nannocystaceae bacterium]
MRRAIAKTLMTLLPLLSACADDGGGAGDDASTGSQTSDADSSGGSTSTASTGAQSSDATTTDDGSSSGSSSTAADSGSTGDTTTGGEVELEVVVAFDPAAYELPEGLVIDGDEAVLGFAFTGAVERVALADGARTAFANTPPPPPNTSFVTGVTLDGDGQLYAAVVSFTADLQAGIYRAGVDGGDATLWASDPAMVFPNGFAWGDDGTLYVTDSVYGGVFAIDGDGLATPWLQDAGLAGDPSNCGGTSDIAVGANGIVRDGDALIVAGGDQGVLVRVPIEADGSAGAPATIAGPDCELAGLDGITLDTDGTVVAAINRSNRVVRIGDDGSVEVLAEGAPLDFPASLEFAGEGDARALYVTSFGLGEFLAGGNPAPALVRVRLP